MKCPLHGEDPVITVWDSHHFPVDLCTSCATHSLEDADLLEALRSQEAIDRFNNERQ